MPPDRSCSRSAPRAPSAPRRIDRSVRTGAVPSSKRRVIAPVPHPPRPQAETRSVRSSRAYGLTVVIVLSTVPFAPVVAPESSNVPSPSLKLTATPASIRPKSASAPSVPVSTSPSRPSRPVSESASPSKRPCAARPQAARPGPAPSPSPARWNALPSSSSRPVIVWAGDEAATRVDGDRAEAGESAPPPSPLRENGSSSFAGACAPKRCPSPASRSASALPSSVRVRSTAWPATVACAPGVRPSTSRPDTASVTWPPTVRPKRDSHACCSASSLVMMPRALRWTFLRYAPRGFESSSRITSLPSSMASSSTGTLTVFAVSPAAKVSVPDVAV